jgi:hypothetical protein
MNWKYNADKTAVFRFIGLRQDIRSIEDPEIQMWLAEGNEPDPPDPLPPPPDPSTIPPSVEERLQAAETLINLILDEEGE